MKLVIEKSVVVITPTVGSAKLADAVEAALAADWTTEKIELPERFTITSVQESWDLLLSKLVKR